MSKCTHILSPRRPPTTSFFHHCSFVFAESHDLETVVGCVISDSVDATGSAGSRRGGLGRGARQLPWERNTSTCCLVIVQERWRHRDFNFFFFGMRKHRFAFSGPNRAKDKSLPPPEEEKKIMKREKSGPVRKKLDSQGYKKFLCTL